jgi:hypothetical protein
MSAMRQHEPDNHAPASATKTVVPLLAAMSLFVLGTLGILGILPLSPFGSGGDEAGSPGRPSPLVRAPAADAQADGAPGWFQLFGVAAADLPALVAAESVVDAVAVSAADSPGSGVTALEEVPTEPAPPPATETPNPTPTDEPASTATASPTASATPDQGIDDLPNGSQQKPDEPVVVILDPQPQPTPPGPGNPSPGERR